MLLVVNALTQNNTLEILWFQIYMMKKKFFDQSLNQGSVLANNITYCYTMWPLEAHKILILSLIIHNT